VLETDKLSDASMIYEAYAEGWTISFSCTGTRARTNDTTP